jgi:hypothetical protein
MYQPNESTRGGENPPSTGSSAQSKQSRLSMKISVDTTDIDRIAIGMRLYDMLDKSNVSNKVHNDDGQQLYQ